MPQSLSGKLGRDVTSADTDQVSKILIIEDQFPICQIYAAALCAANHNYDVSLAYTGEEGVAAALRDRPDLVILDLALPGMSGFEVADALRQAGIFPEVPLIIASGDGMMVSDLAEILNAAAVLEKPFHIETLVGAIHAALSGSVQ